MRIDLATLPTSKTDPVRWKMCTRKVRYYKLSTANKAAARANVHIRRGEPLYHAYACDYGEHWHIGHMRKGDA